MVPGLETSNQVHVHHELSQDVACIIVVYMCSGPLIVKTWICLLCALQAVSCRSSMSGNHSRRLVKLYNVLTAVFSIHILDCILALRSS
jgi:hypothetical protein